MASSRQPARRLPLLPLAFGAIVVLGVVAVIASRGGDGTDVPEGVEQTRPVTVEGTPLPEVDDGSDPAVGMTIPEVMGASFDGTEIAIRPDGTPKVVLFLAHWCPHCQREVPVVADWIAENGAPAGVEMVSVSTAVSDNQPNYPPSAWLEDEGWPLPVLADDAEGSAADAFGVSGFPFFVAVDADGAVVVRASGQIGTDALAQLAAAARG